jgi:hypothetical protein
VTDLSHEARVVVDAGKNVFQPTNADRLRVTQVLAQRMGAATLGISSSSQAAPRLGSGHSLATMLKVIGTVGFVAIGGVYYLANRNVPPLPPSQKAVATQSSVIPEPSHPEASSPLTVPVVIEPATSVQPARLDKSQRSNRSRGDSLGEEVAILTRAGKELHNGMPAAALRALDEHQRRFPSGSLAQERSATRIQALCALGRVSEAGAEAAKLARTARGSPQISSAERPCAPR